MVFFDPGQLGSGDVIPAPDGYQYGVRFQDGGVAARWNGRTQRQRAQAYIEQVQAQQRQWLAERGSDRKPDWLVLVRRRPGGEWRPVCRCGGSGWVRDATWCGDESCCPEYLNCLVCNPTYREPPEGWYTFGHHADQPFDPLEFSEEVGEDGLPLWERPVRRNLNGR